MNHHSNYNRGDDNLENNDDMEDELANNNSGSDSDDHPNNLLC